ncbi:hypothetical protein SAMN05920897_10559 [Alkalispirochaeta americana]|uniref:Uncharacterized protein n=1 Tax=Alkalispirochaeta americana TaxID=159291 RepID=A0A1N6QUW4_9SPIO|nr:MG2 domain-containing protein [Alkalispirochaeta americana]SIQ20401.1 hypothetical protein SAMN05920897_10559 [Alkalispirochaeta americana]
MSNSSPSGKRLSSIAAGILHSALLGTLLGVVLLGTALSCSRGETAQTTPGDQGASPHDAIRTARDFQVPSSFLQGTLVYYRPDRDESGCVEATQHGQGDLLETAEPVRPLDWGPRDELPTENRRPRVYVTFDQPLVPLAMLGTEQRESSVLTLDPPIPGRYRWYGSRTIAFTPDEPIDGQRPIRVSLGQALLSGDGSALHRDYRDFSFSFFREHLDLVQVLPDGGDQIPNPLQLPPDQRRFTLLFNGPVDPDHVKNYIRLEVGQREGAGQKETEEKKTSPPEAPGFSLTHPRHESVQGDLNLRARSLVLELEEALPENREIRIILEAGASPFPGYIATTGDSVHTFHTITPFKKTGFSTRSYAFARSPQGDSNPLYIEFSHPLDKDSLDGNITVSLDLKDEAVTEFLDVHRQILRVNNLPVVYESTYTLTLGANLRDIYGRTLGTPRDLTIEVPRATRYSHFPNRGSRFLEAQFEPKIIFEHQNIDDGVWLAASIDDPFESFPAERLEPYDFSDVPENTRWFDVLNLSPYLKANGTGWVGLSWNFAEKNHRGERPSWAQANLQLQVTNLGLSVRYGYNRVLVWVRDLRDNNPVAGAMVSLLPSSRETDHGHRALTDSRGLAAIDIAPGVFRGIYTNRNDWDDFIIRVKSDSDLVEFKPNHSHNAWAQGIRASRNPGGIEDPQRATFLFNDRGIYRPGETITFRGIDRDLILGEYQVYQGDYTIKLVSSDWRAQGDYGSISGITTENGGFHGSFELPREMNPGFYYLEYAREGAPAHDRERLPVQVAYFRRAAFSVSLQPPDYQVLAGEQAAVGISAEYLAGGAMTAAPYHYDLSREPVVYQPPGREWEDYRFGPKQPRTGRSHLAQGQGQLDNTGRALEQISFDFSGTARGVPQKYQIEARVQDADSQEIAGRTSFIVHPAEIYAAMRISRKTRGHWGGYFVEAQTPFQVDLRLARIDGSLPPEDYPGKDTFELEVVRTEWKMVQQQGLGGRIHTRYEPEEVTVLRREISFRNSAGRLELNLPESGSYTLRLDGTDSQGRAVLTELELYASGSGFTRWGGDTARSIRLQPDRAVYQAGDLARIFVQTPLPRGEYLLTTEREGLLSHEIITIEGSQSVIEIPLEEAHVPVLYVMLTSASERQETPSSYFEPDLGKPRGYFGAALLEIDPDPRRFDIEINPSRQGYAPGETARVQLRVSRQGHPLEGAEVTLMATDRGVLDLIDHRVPDPVSFFYNPGRFPLGTAGADSRSLLIDPVTYDITSLQGGEAGAGKGMDRSDFRPTAFFEPFLTSDADGLIEVDINLPDTLTTYRLTALGVKDNTFALEESELLVSSPLPMRASLPRKLRERDTARAGVVLRNLSGTSRNVRITLDLQAPPDGDSPAGLVLDGAEEITLTLENNESREVSFQIGALRQGTYDLVFDLHARDIEGDIFQDRLRASLEVERGITSESVAVFGTVPPGTGEDPGKVREGFSFPHAAAPGFGELRLQFHTTRLHQLSREVAALDEIWHVSLSSRIARLTSPLLLGKGFTELTGRRGDHQEDLRTLVAEIETLQHSDGGFVEFTDLLAGITSSNPWTTLRTAHFLAEYTRLYEEELPRGLDKESLGLYLGRLVQDSRQDIHLRSYAFFAGSLLQGTSLGAARTLLQEETALGMDCLGLIALGVLQNPKDPGAAETIARDVLRKMMNLVNISPRGVEFLQTYQARHYFDSPARRLSLLSLLLETLEPDSPHLDRVAHSLVQELTAQNWSGRDDLLWGVRALARPLAHGDTSHIESPEEEALGVSINETEVLSAKAPGLYDGTDLFTFPLHEPPLSALPRDTEVPLELFLQGSRDLHYAAVMTYALPGEILHSRDEGLGVNRWIETLEGETLAAQELQRGETYRMVIHLEAPSQYYNLALRAPLPSGAEVIDGSLKTSGQYTARGGIEQRSWQRETQYGDTREYIDEGYLYPGPDGWHHHSLQPIRRIFDSEIQYYFSSFYAGSQTISFLFRALYPGMYPLPPARAELLQEPEVFGRTAGTLSIIQ